MFKRKILSLGLTCMIGLGLLGNFAVKSNATNTVDKIFNEEIVVSIGDSEKSDIKDCIETTDGGFVGLLNTTSPEFNTTSDRDFVLAKYKDNSLLWSKTYSADNLMHCRDIAPSPDGGFVVVGNTGKNEILNTPADNYVDAFIIKHSKDGDVEWKKSFGGNEFDTFDNVLLVNDGYICVGNSDSTNIDGLGDMSLNDMIIVKYDFNGNVVKSKLIKGDFIYGATYFEIYEFQDTILISTDKGGEFKLFNLDNNLNVLWEKNINNCGVYLSILNDEIVTLIGRTSEDFSMPTMQFIKYDNNGDLIYEGSVMDVNDMEYLIYNITSKDNQIYGVGIDLSMYRVCLLELDNDFNVINYQLIDDIIPMSTKSIKTGGFLLNVVNDNSQAMVIKYTPTSSKPKAQTASDDLQITVEADNSLELALSTNQVTFANYNGTQDFTNNDLNVTVSSGLNYDLSATMLEEFTPTFDSSAVMPSELLNIKLATDNESNYKPFTVGTPILLSENNSNGKDIVHNINFKLKGDSSVKSDTYNTSIRFEATQK